MVNIFAVTTRGLEAVCADELSRFPGISHLKTSYRIVSAVCHESVQQLLSLRTADDLFIDLGQWHQVPKQRSALDYFRQNSPQLNLTTAVQEISNIRPLPTRPHFSVTANFVGKRNYSTTEIKEAVADGIKAKFHWVYTSDDQYSDLNIRIFIEHEVATIGIRINETALQKRIYKLGHTLGSLKPPVAAAMVRLLNPTDDDLVLDPFCGAGTILIEASQMGYKTLGGDNSPEALQAAVENASQAGITTHLNCWDALHLPLLNNSIQTIVTNIPWGRQIEVSQDIQKYHARLLKELSRILINFGKAVILTNHPDITCNNLLVLKSLEISLFGQNPKIIVYEKNE